MKLCWLHWLNPNKEATVCGRLKWFKSNACLNFRSSEPNGWTTARVRKESITLYAFTTLEIVYGVHSMDVWPSDTSDPIESIEFTGMPVDPPRSTYCESFSGRIRQSESTTCSLHAAISLERLSCKQRLRAALSGRHTVWRLFADGPYCHCDNVTVLLWRTELGDLMLWHSPKRIWGSDEDAGKLLKLWKAFSCLPFFISPSFIFLYSLKEFLSNLLNVQFSLLSFAAIS